jgi:ubiquinone/menaquinone biosynthesis C-methylase UbiE
VSTPGRLIEGALRYDLKAWARARGRPGAFHRELFELAQLAEGDSVLDVGCGTGSLAIAARRRVGPRGSAAGIDPSAEMIERARAEARRARVNVAFETGAGQELPYPDASFDVAFATLMLHHLSPENRHRTLAELKRVLVPGGRLLAVDLDLAHPGNPRHAPHAHAHAHGHGHGTPPRFDLAEVAQLLDHLGLTVAAEGPVSFRYARFERMRYLLART